MSSYDPLSADILVDVTIGATSYIVKAFTDAGDGASEVTFTTSAGAWRGRRIVKGERTGTMTIERTNAAQSAPAQLAVFTYRGQQWVIKQVAASAASESPSTFELTLGWVAIAT
jgi:hypothetical protein